MIKLEREKKPDFLTDEKRKELTEEFKKTGKSVWHIDDLKDALLKSSNKKCAYCECTLQEESKYAEVEHYKHKDSYPDDVIKWENLLPACRRCNGSKSTHDVINEPIVNPYDNDPRDHFKLKLYRIRHKTQQGLFSIEALNLNDSDRIVQVRFEIGEKLQDSLSSLNEKLEKYLFKKNIRSKNLFITHFKKLLKECQPTAEYSATTSTLIHSEETYNDLIEVCKKEGIWDQDLEGLHQASLRLVLDYA